MERRSWPWRRRTSEKAKTASSDSMTAAFSSYPVNEGHQVDFDPKSHDNLQITTESDAYLSDMETKTKELSEKLSSTQSDIIALDNLVKQQTKVAEEAVRDKKKTELEAKALKDRLESVTLEKHEAENKIGHLELAVADWMKQLQNVKEQSEQRLSNVLFNKTKQWEKIRSELEEKIVSLDREFMKASDENEALSKSLQKCSDELKRRHEDESEAEAEIETLKIEIVSLEKEISSLKYELSVVSKELEIRNEEKNMSMRVAELANKKHSEDTEKIMKLEAECQKLRGLLRMKLPGAAALAQMKHEVGTLGGERRSARASPKKSRHCPSSRSNGAFENIQYLQDENEFLKMRLLAAEDETTMLKEALSTRNSELEAAREMYARSAGALGSNEAHNLTSNHQKSHSKSDFGDSQVTNEGKALRSTSTSKDANDAEESFSESWAITLPEKMPQYKKEENVDEGNKIQISSNLKLMDDFLEMERLAGLSSENGEILVVSGEEISNINSTNIGTNSFTGMVHTVVEQLKDSISIIHRFVISLAQEVTVNQGKLLDATQSKKVELFSAVTNKVLSSQIGLDEFIAAFSCILSEIREFGNEGRNSYSDCIGKATLLEKVWIHEPTKNTFSGECTHGSPSASDTENFQNKDNPSYELRCKLQEYNLEDYEKLQSEKDNLATDLARCTETLEQTKSQLLQKEQQLVELNSQLVACQETIGLAETKLKCMAESCKSLESQKEELQNEVDDLRTKAETLGSLLEEERCRHQDNLANKLKDPEGKLERNEKCSMCTVHSEAGIEVKGRQEREIAAAEEKLAECQETIFLLSKQLKALHPSNELISSPENNKQTKTTAVMEHVESQNVCKSVHSDQHEMKNASQNDCNLDASESYMRSPSSTGESLVITPCSSSKGSKKRPSRSNSSSLSNLPEEHGSRFARFFSKGKNRS